MGRTVRVIVIPNSSVKDVLRKKTVLTPKSVMAAESETSSLLKPAIAKLPVNKVNPVEDVQEGEEEEDELQMESGETIDDSLKLNCTDMDDSRDQENQSRDNKRSHSNSRSRNSRVQRMR